MSFSKRTYEAIVILSPELNEEQSGKFLSQLSDLVSRHEGRVIETLPLGKRKLAYGIGRRSEGIFYQVKVELAPAQVIHVDKAVKAMDSCLRVMMTHESGLPAQAAEAPAHRREEAAPAANPAAAKSV